MAHFMPLVCIWCIQRVYHGITQAYYAFRAIFVTKGTEALLMGMDQTYPTHHLAASHPRGRELREGLPKLQGSVSTQTRLSLPISVWTFYKTIQFPLMDGNQAKYSNFYVLSVTAGTLLYLFNFKSFPFWGETALAVLLAYSILRVFKGAFSTNRCHIAETLLE